MSKDFQFKSSLSDSSEMSRCQFLSTSSLELSPDHDHCDDYDDDIQEFWWDEQVCQFPAQFYTLLSPTDYEELFGNDDEEQCETEEQYDNDAVYDHATVYDHAHATMYDHHTNMTRSAAMFQARSAAMFHAKSVRMFHANSARMFHANSARMSKFAKFDHQPVTKTSLLKLLMTSPRPTYTSKKEKEKMEKKRPTPNHSCELARRERGLREKG